MRLRSNLFLVFFLPDRPKHSLLAYRVVFVLVAGWFSRARNLVRLHVFAWLTFCIYVHLECRLGLPRGVAASEGGLLPPLPPGWRPPLPPAAVLPKHTVRRLRARNPTRRGTAAGVPAEVVPVLVPDVPPPGALCVGRLRTGAGTVDIAN